MGNSKKVKKESAQQPAFSMLPLSLIDKSNFNPRKTFSDSDLAELAESIKAQGVIQPIVVRSKGERYEVVCGERRYRASLMASVETIPACIRELSDEDAEEFAITENLQRKDVLPMEEARAFNRLIESNRYDIASLVLKFGKSEVFVRSRIKLAQLIESFQELLEREEINLGVANVISNCSEETQEMLYNEHFEAEVAYYSSWRTKRPAELLKSIEGAYSKKLDTYSFDKTDCKSCHFNTANFSLFTEGAACGGTCTKKDCLTEKNNAYVISQALNYQQENPTFSFGVKKGNNGNIAALQVLQESGNEIAEVYFVNADNDNPIAPEREDFEDEAEYEEARIEYEEEVNDFAKEKAELEKQVKSGELVPFIQVGTTDVQIAYAKKKAVEEAIQDSSEAKETMQEVQKLENKINRNNELCGEKIRESLRNALKQIEIDGTGLSHLEETLKYFFMMRKVRSESYSLLGLEKKLYNLEYTDLLELTEEQKTIITREYLINHLDDLCISSIKIKENNALRVFLNQHTPNEVSRIDEEQDTIYNKRNARLMERIQAVNSETKSEVVPMQLSTGDNVCTLIDTLYANYISEYGKEPLYAECSIMYLDDNSTHDDIIKLSLDISDGEDENIFFSCNSLSDFKSLVNPENSDFKVVTCYSLK